MKNFTTEKPAVNADELTPLLGHLQSRITVLQSKLDTPLPQLDDLAAFLQELKELTQLPLSSSGQSFRLADTRLEKAMDDLFSTYLGQSLETTACPSTRYPLPVAQANVPKCLSALAELNNDLPRDQYPVLVQFIKQ